MHDKSCRNPNQYSLNTPSDYTAQLDSKGNKTWYIPPSVSSSTWYPAQCSQVLSPGAPTHTTPTAAAPHKVMCVTLCGLMSHGQHRGQGFLLLHTYIHVSAVPRAQHPLIWLQLKIYLKLSQQSILYSVGNVSEWIMNWKPHGQN